MTDENTDLVAVVGDELKETKRLAGRLHLEVEFPGQPRLTVHDVYNKFNKLNKLLLLSTALLTLTCQFYYFISILYVNI